MTEKKPPATPGAEMNWATAMPTEDEEQRAKLTEAATEFHVEMEQMAARIALSFAVSPSSSYSEHAVAFGSIWYSIYSSIETH
jgi:hypothetical protein